MECGAASTETGAVPTTLAPGCSCEHLQDRPELRKDIHWGFLYIGVVAGQDTSSVEQGEGQDIAPHIQMLLCCALVLVVKPFGLPSPELKTCGQ